MKSSVVVFPLHFVLTSVGFSDDELFATLLLIDLYSPVLPLVFLQRSISFSFVW